MYILLKFYITEIWADKHKLRLYLKSGYRIHIVSTPYYHGTKTLTNSVIYVYRLGFSLTQMYRPTHGLSFIIFSAKFADQQS